MKKKRIYFRPILAGVMSTAFIFVSFAYSTVWSAML